MRCRPSSPGRGAQVCRPVDPTPRLAWYGRQITRKSLRVFVDARAVLLPAQADEHPGVTAVAARSGRSLLAPAPPTPPRAAVAAAGPWLGLHATDPEKRRVEIAYIVHKCACTDVCGPRRVGSGPNSASRFQPRSVGNCEIASRSSDSSCHKSSGELTPPGNRQPIPRMAIGSALRSCPSTGCRRVPCDPVASALDCVGSQSSAAISQQAFVRRGTARP